MSIADSIKIPIPCPECGERPLTTIARLEQDYQLVCQSCGAKIALREKHVRALREALNRMDQALSHAGQERREGDDTRAIREEHVHTLDESFDEIDLVLWRLKLKHR